MSDITNGWRELRSKLGDLICHIDGMNESIESKMKKLQEKEEEQAELQEQIDKAYNKGLDDAYNAMAYLYECEDCCSKELLCKIFGTSYIPTIIENYSMGKIIVMVNHIKKENEEAKEKQDFRVGDEIICTNEDNLIPKLKTDRNLYPVSFLEFNWYLPAKDEEHALKIAQDKRAMLLEKYYMDKNESNLKKEENE